MNLFKNFFSYHSNIPPRLHFISLAFLFIAVCSFFATPFFMTEKIDIKYILLLGIISLLISVGLSKLKRWSAYLIVTTIVISFFVIKLVEITIIFLLAFFIVMFYWKKLN